MLEIPDIFWGGTVDAGSEPTYAEKIRVPPLGSYVTARNCKFLKCTFICTGIGITYMKKVFKKYLDIHSRGKSDKTVF